MADPIIEVLEGNKNNITKKIKESVSELDMEIVGSNYELGLLSFKAEPGMVLYTHIVEIEGSKSRITLAPGIPHLGDREQSVIPTKRFNKLIKSLKIKMTKS